MSALSRETNLAPTFALKVDFPHGVSVRGSVSTSNRLPTPQLSKPIATGGGTDGGVNYASVYDPRRDQTYLVQSGDALDPNLRPEDSLTSTAGIVYQHGTRHRFRVGLDFVDTHKNNEVYVLDSQALIDLEAYFPTRVIRDPLSPGDPHAVGPVTSLITGAVNVATRHSQNWNFTLDYAWTECLGGTLEAYAHLIYFQRYDRQVFPNSPVVDELNHSDGLASGLLRIRSNFGLGWSNPAWGLGLEGHYFHARILPILERPAQGSRQIDPFTQFDAYLQSDLGRWLPWKHASYGLRGQLRVDNVFGTGFPRYANEPAGTGVQPYGDWRGRTYSLSLTATF